ncbi:hypothetical protein RU639_004497 [Aspergillus parasiticus]
MGGNFYQSARNVHMEDSTLVAELRNLNGEWEFTGLDLNSFFSNDDGRFGWPGKEFAETAEEIKFNFEGKDNAPVLRAKLQNAQGKWVEAKIDLSEWLFAKEGHIEFEWDHDE